MILHCSKQCCNRKTVGCNASATWLGGARCRVTTTATHKTVDSVANFSWEAKGPTLEQGLATNGKQEVQKVIKRITGQRDKVLEQGRGWSGRCRGNSLRTTAGPKKRKKNNWWSDRETLAEDFHFYKGQRVTPNSHNERAGSDNGRGRVVWQNKLGPTLPAGSGSSSVTDILFHIYWSKQWMFCQTPSVPIIHLFSMWISSFSVFAAVWRIIFCLFFPELDLKEELYTGASSLLISVHANLIVSLINTRIVVYVAIVTEDLFALWPFWGKHESSSQMVQPRLLH